MPFLSVRLHEGIKTVEFPRGTSIREILDTTNIRVRSGCRGNGSCGLCRIRIEKGIVNSPTHNELIHLADGQLSAGVRLACQTVPHGDVEIIVMNPSAPPQWKTIPGGVRRNHLTPARTAIALPEDVKNPYGIAVDLGTTHISLSISELLTGKRIADRYGLNPQAVYGHDIMTRLTSAAASDETAGRMSRLGISAIGDALTDMSKREGIDLKQAVYFCLVGNTAMLSLLTGKNYLLLLQPKRWMEYIDCLPVDRPQWQEAWGIHPEAVIDIIPPLAGFVGSDLLAGIASSPSGGTASPPFLFMDFGTNSEIALWDGRSFRVTSAAGGPAFESWGIGCGMPAEAGAVYRVDLKGESLEYDIIDGMKAKGLCGTGFIDLVASLLKLGVVSETGKVRSAGARDGYTLTEGVRITSHDIDALQRAKAAIGTAVDVLISLSGMTFADISRISVAGVFGRFLNISSAQEIGLLPPIDPLRVDLMGNTALAGCEDIMLSTEAAERVREIRERAEVINLSQYPLFGELFLKNLYLRPMGS
ncbi:MAG: ASKHA domain-containing protein [Thermodesulfovibrionales bacterium]|jgi:uncharacterized 2Fe-2S/4Fe-4S cluster protein (DUF4445 family)